MNPRKAGSDPEKRAMAVTWQECLRAGQQCLAAGRPGDAILALRLANRLQPGRSPIVLSLAIAWLRTGEADKALACFNEVMGLDPADLQARHGRGLALDALDQREEALAAFRAVTSNSRDAWASWQSIADITPHEDERIHAIDQAADALVRLCERGQPAARLFTSCAAALLDAHRGRAAIAFIAGNASRFPDAATVHDCLARARYETGDFREAFRQKQCAVSRRRGPGPERLPAGFSPDTAAGALCSIGEILDAAGVPFFLAAGTLLGFYRAGQPLAHDRDVDIGILASQDGAADVARIIRDHSGLVLARRARPADRYFALTVKGIGVDIFLYELSGDALHCGLGRLTGDVAWRFTPFRLKTASFKGATWNIPDNPERYLAETYGPGWQTPDEGFASVISSPALFQVDPYTRAYYALSRADKALKQGDSEKAAALLRQSPVPISLACPGDDGPLPAAQVDLADRWLDESQEPGSAN
ncbi:tetratricopeptide repeat protein [Hyphomonas sp. BRH_c22]|uniref:tetratricopeptide repeat protein n=1 Tax=Hyphomonas sp. BRH_c22 TaxID=1629710 RepID=UPI000A97955A|nr:tetratricopeptide repeat protein [Hyphomonas sp. BRH_c22]